MTERAQALEAALRKLRNACHIIKALSYDEIKASAGYTNLKCWIDRMDEADALLAVQPPPPVGSPTTEDAFKAGFQAAQRWGVDMEQEAWEDFATPVEPAGASEPPSEKEGVGPHPHEFIDVAVCRQCLRTEADIDGTCHHCDEGDGARCWWCLRLKSPAPVSPVEPTPNDTLLRNIRMAAAMGLSFGHQATPQPMERMVERKDKRLRQILTLLAEHGVTGSMLRAESNAPVEPAGASEPPMIGQVRLCGALHLGTGAVCELPLDHAENHRGSFSRGIAQWPYFDARDQSPAPVSPEPPHVREDYRDVWLSGWRAGSAPTGAPAPCVWRDIASAPKDETPIRLKWAGTTVEAIGRWCPAQVLPSGFGRSNYSDDWRDVEGDDVLLLPTHWKPVIVSGSPLKVER